MDRIACFSLFFFFFFAINNKTVIVNYIVNHYHLYIAVVYYTLHLDFLTPKVFIFFIYISWSWLNWTANCVYIFIHTERYFTTLICMVVESAVWWSHVTMVLAELNMWLLFNKICLQIFFFFKQEIEQECTGDTVHAVSSVAHNAVKCVLFCV